MSGSKRGFLVTPTFNFEHSFLSRFLDVLLLHTTAWRTTSNWLGEIERDGHGPRHFYLTVPISSEDKNAGDILDIGRCFRYERKVRDFGSVEVRK